MSSSTSQQNLHWLAAYALGVAFSVPDDEIARAQLLEVTSDQHDLLKARARLAAIESADDATRRRAAELLTRAMTSGDAAVTSKTAEASR